MRLLILLLCAAALSAGDPPAPPAAIDVIPEFALIPSDFQIDQRTRFSPSGEPQSAERSCRLTLALRLLSNQLRMGTNRRNDQHQIVLTAADTDAGESLVEDDLQHELWVQQGLRGRQDNEPAARLNLSLKAPSRPCTGFKRLSGSVTLQLAGGKLRRIELKPIGRLAGTRVAIEGLDGLDLGIELRPDQVRLSSPPALYNLITEVKFFTVEGQELPSNGQGSNGSGQRIECEYRVSVPADGSAMLFLLENVRSVKIPFDLKDVAIIPEAERAKPTTVLKAVEVENSDTHLLPLGKSNF